MINSNIVTNLFNDIGQFFNKIIDAMPPTPLLNGDIDKANNQEEPDAREVTESYDAFVAEQEDHPSKPISEQTIEEQYDDITLGT